MRFTYLGKKCAFVVYCSFLMHASRGFAKVIASRATVDGWRGAYAKYGGSARNLYTHTEKTLEKNIASAMKCADVAKLLDAAEAEGEGSNSHALIQINPLQNDDGTFDRESMATQITSLHIVEILWQKRMATLLTFAQDKFESALRDNASRASAGILFEGIGHHYLFEEAKKNGIQVLSLESGHSTPKSSILCLSHIKEMAYFGKDLLQSDWKQASVLPAHAPQISRYRLVRF